MLSFHTLSPNLSRREWLHLGGLAAFGLTSSLQAAPARGSFGKAKSCIVFFLLGGPPQHETFDPKPDAPSGIRGDFKPIATSVPGVHVGELMPRTARLMHRLCVLRSVSTSDNAHSSSGYWMLTGQQHLPTNSENAKPGAPNDWPSTAAIVQKMRPARNGLPASVVLPEHIWNNGPVSWPGQDGGFLGRSADPWLIPCDPSKPGFEVGGLSLPMDVSRDRLHDRLSLLERLDKRGATGGFEHRYQQALGLVRAGKGRTAFRLENESTKVRERYGMNRFGQSVLLARRLVEAGVSLVQVNYTRMPGDPTDSPAWDTHRSNAARLKANLMPKMDLAYSALLEDLEARGMLDETLIVWMGEFGRTPKINGGGGRDHWGHVFSVALAGGGTRGGTVIGSSDSNGAYVREARVTPPDLQATVFHCLGLEAHREMHDALGRPIAITRGRVLSQAVT